MAKTALFRRIRKLVIESQKEPSDPSAENTDLLLKRREFLIQSSAVIAGSALIPQMTWAKNKDASPVVIIGAGAAGLAAAYQLQKAGKKFVIYEASARIGGRIYTEKNINEDGQFCERGAELVDTPHKNLLQLCKELQVEIETFADEPGVKNFAPLFHFNGKFYTEEQFRQGLLPLLEQIRKVKAKIQSKDGNLTLRYDNKNQFPAEMFKYENMTLQAFLHEMEKFCEKWVLRIIEIAYVGEYGAASEYQSALNLISMIPDTMDEKFNVFGESDEAHRIKGGNSRLIEKLTEKITAGKEEVIHTGHQLVSISQKNATLLLHFKVGEKSVEVKTSQAICTLPFSVLRELEGLEKIGLTALKLRAINELRYGTNSKFMLSFKSQFWHQGFKTTPASSGETYTELGSECFWETSRLQGGNSGVLTNFLGGHAGMNARKPDVEKTALDDLSKIYNGFDLRGQFSKSILHNWNLIPTAKGSYTSFGPGQYSAFFGGIGKSELGGKLLFAGEHTSESWAGFMEGAFESGNLAAQQIIAKR